MEGDNDKADRGYGDGDLDKVDEGRPETGGNDAENGVHEDKRKEALLLDCLSHGRAKWPDDGIMTSHMYAVVGFATLMGLQPFAEIRFHRDSRPMHDFPVRESMKRTPSYSSMYCWYMHMASKQKNRLTPGDYYSSSTGYYTIYT